MDESKQGTIAPVQFAPAVITADWDAMRAQMDEHTAIYRDATPETLAKLDTAALKADRAELNRIIKSVEDGRKAIKAQYNAPLKEFEAKVKELLQPARDAENLMGYEVNRRRDEARALKREGLERTYHDFAPALVPVVPFERILDDAWLNAGFNAVKACEEMEAKVERIAHDWDVLKMKRSTLAFPGETEAEFFRTLDLAKALEYDGRRAEEQARIDAMRLDVARNQAAQQVQQAAAQDGTRARYRIRVDMEMQLTADELQEVVAGLKALGLSGKVNKVKEVA